MTYSWGDDTSAWKNPGTYDYGAAKAPYLDELKKKAEETGSRTYTQISKPQLQLVDPKNKTINSTSKNPISIAIDGTGSMQTWPAEIFDRLPLLYQTLSKYRDDVDCSFSVIGDTVSDDWPLQVTDFGKDITLDSYLKALKPEGRGGPGIRESYELFGYFMNTHAKTPNAELPFLFMMGDEKFYENINPAQVKQYIGDTILAPLNSQEMWQQLAQKFDIYFLRKPYPGKDEEISAQWKQAIGAQKVIDLYDPLRVIDVAMGIVAKKWGYFGDFEQNLSARQDSNGINSVMASLKLAPGVNPGDGMKSMQLLANEKSASATAPKKSIKLLTEE